MKMSGRDSLFKNGRILSKSFFHRGNLGLGEEAKLNRSEAPQVERDLRSYVTDRRNEAIGCRADAGTNSHFWGIRATVSLH